MKRHCTEIGCIVLIGLSMVNPIALCYSHIDCHTHDDEQAKTITVTGSAVISNATVYSSAIGTTGPSGSVES